MTDNLLGKIKRLEVTYNDSHVKWFRRMLQLSFAVKLDQET